jgi:hypothetical protein
MRGVESYGCSESSRHLVGRRVTDVERDTWQDLGLDDEHILQLGRIAIALSNIEYLTTNMLLPLIGQDGWAGRLVVGGEPLTWQLDRIKRLAPFRLEPALAAEIVGWTQQVREASTQRNRMLHLAWHADPEAGTLHSLGYRRGEVDDAGPMTLEVLRALAEQLGALFHTTFDLMSLVWLSGQSSGSAPNTATSSLRIRRTKPERARFPGPRPPTDPDVPPNCRQ